MLFISLADFLVSHRLSEAGLKYKASFNEDSSYILEKYLGI